MLPNCPDYQRPSLCQLRNRGSWDFSRHYKGFGVISGIVERGPQGCLLLLCHISVTCITCIDGFYRPTYKRTAMKVQRVESCVLAIFYNFRPNCRYGKQLYRQYRKFKKGYTWKKDNFYQTSQVQFSVQHNA